MKDELGGKIMTKIAPLRPKTYIYLTGDTDKKKANDRKKFVVKRNLKLEDYKHCLEATQLENKINHLEKNNFNVDNL